MQGWEILQDELGSTEELEEPVHCQLNHSSLGEMSVLCNIRVPYTVQARENSKLLRLDKQSILNLLDVYFSDGRFIINNLLEVSPTALKPCWTYTLYTKYDLNCNL